MIVDVHSHLFRHSDINPPFQTDATRSRAEAIDLHVTWDRYAVSAPPGSKAIVIGGKARASGLWVPDEAVAAYVAEHHDRLIGYLSLDPTQPGWEDELRQGHRVLGLRGIKIMPMYAGFDPANHAYDPLYGYAQSEGLPLLVHTGTTFVSSAPLRWAMPVHLDEVATRFPGLRMVLAHLGHPFEGECLAVIRKHQYVYADISALHYRPFQLWHSLRLAQDYGVWHKLMFGTDFPFATVNETIRGLRHVAAVAGIPGLDPLDRAEMEKLINRDSLSLLGLT